MKKFSIMFIFLLAISLFIAPEVFADLGMTIEGAYKHEAVEFESANDIEPGKVKVVVKQFENGSCTWNGWKETGGANNADYTSEEIKAEWLKPGGMYNYYITSDNHTFKTGTNNEVGIFIMIGQSGNLIGEGDVFTATITDENGAVIVGGRRLP